MCIRDRGDATNETTLRELGVSNFDAAVVAVGSDMQSSLMSSVLLTTLDVPLIVGRAENQLHGNTLQRVGVHKIIYPEQESGELIARSLFFPDVLEYMDLTSNFGISKIQIPPNLSGMTLKDIGIGEGLFFTALGLEGGTRDKHGVAIIAIIRGKEVLLAPNQEDNLQRGDILIVAAEAAQLA